MWKAAGSPDGRAPADWRALSSTAAFVEHIELILNAGKSGNELFKVARGGKAPGTAAHWQIALAEDFIEHVRLMVGNSHFA